MAEALVPQAEIPRRAARPLAAAPERLEPPVLDARLGQGRGETIPVEVRVLPGAGEPPDVSQGLDFVPIEELQEPVERVGGMADGEKPGVGWSADLRFRTGRAVSAGGSPVTASRPVSPSSSVGRNPASEASRSPS